MSLVRETGVKQLEKNKTASRKEKRKKKEESGQGVLYVLQLHFVLTTTLTANKERYREHGHQNIIKDLG